MLLTKCHAAADGVPGTVVRAGGSVANSRCSIAPKAVGNRQKVTVPSIEKLNRFVLQGIRCWKKFQTKSQAASGSTMIIALVDEKVHEDTEGVEEVKR